MSTFAGAIIAWHRLHGRHDLPWQNTREPYPIWLSEIMLQQTQVATVRPYFTRFIEKFGDLATLAAAPVDEVMTAWAGLGYYSRARNLHRCARQIIDRHDGQFPSTSEELSSLPGIGRSTAAAIAVFAFGERAAILDGNVRRVLARHFAIEAPTGTTAASRAFWHAAERELPASDIESYTQGLMDLGATVCTRTRPGCERCPVRGTCEALRTGRVDSLPLPRSARARPLRTATLIVLRDTTGAVLMHRRPPAGIWGGMTSLPEFDHALDDDALVQAAARELGLAVKLEDRLEPLRHEFTHYSFLMRPRLARSSAGTRAAESAELVWIDPAKLESVALPAPIRRLLAALPDLAEATAMY